MDFLSTHQYQTCQTLFDQVYPDFRNAGQKYQQILGELVDPGTQVLELGCGRDSLASVQLARAKTLIGVDPSYSDLVENDTVWHPVTAVGDGIPFSAGSFDLVTCQWVMEHIAFPETVFRECARVLRPGGHVVIFTTNWRNYIARLNYLLPHRVQAWLAERLLQRPERETFPAYYRANTRRAIHMLAQEAGLTLSTCEYVGNPFYFAFAPSLFRLALRFEQFTDHPPLQRYKLYMLAVLRKP